MTFHATALYPYSESCFNNIILSSLVCSLFQGKFKSIKKSPFFMVMDEDDTIALSDHATRALMEFLDEQRQASERLIEMQRQNIINETQDAELVENDSADTLNTAPVPVGIDLFKEDWQLSQFWVSSVY
jgi:hypothetical protein